jgi:hypothetical protein
MNKNYLNLVRSSLLASGVMLAAIMPVQAANFTVTGELTGDPRNDNPDLLSVDVTIDVFDSVATWTVLPDASIHTTIKMDEFYFNLANVVADDITVALINPENWTFSSPATEVGGGNIDFLFEYAAPNGNQNQVPVSGSLQFTTTLNTGNWTLDNFLNAPQSPSSDMVLGSGQMGAHLQALTVNDETCPDGGCSDSGFVLGNYNDGDNHQGVPEPGTALALGLLAFGSLSCAKKKKA